MSNPRFKVGDKVVYLKNIYTEEITIIHAEVIAINSNKPFPIYIKWEEPGMFETEQLKDGPWIIHEEVYNSPLYKALSED